MSQKYIDNNTYAARGYTLSGTYASITIGSVGSIGGHGVVGGKKEAYSIVNRGRITSTGTDAIYLGGGGTVRNFGRIIDRGSSGNGVSMTGGGTVANSGTILSGKSFGYGVYINGSGTVTNSVGALITGSSGVYIFNSANDYATLSNSGTIIGTSNFGVEAEYGVLTNVAGGRIQGGISGVTADSATINNFGTIMATATTSAYGIYIVHGAVDNTGSGALVRGGIYIKNTGTITNSSGAIIVGGSGVRVMNGGTINNDIGARIEGSFGVRLDVGAVTNSGTIIAIDDIGVELGSGIITNAGTINAVDLLASGGIDIVSGTVDNTKSTSLIEGYRGLYNSAGNSNLTVSVANYGTIEGTGKGGRNGIDFKTNAFITNTSSGLIIGGIYIESTGTITNGAGAAIRGGAGITIGGSIGTVSNATGALIEGTSGVEVMKGTGTIDNSGMIIGSVGVGVWLAGGTIVNNGTIRSAGATLESEGVYIANGTVGNKTASLIQGYFGLYNEDASDGDDIVTVDNSGVIQGDGLGNYNGVHLKTNGIIINFTGARISGGIYIGGSGTIVNSANILGGSGVCFNGGGTVVNYARIEGSYGVQIGGGTGTISNSGMIIATSEIGVSLSGGAVTNSGTIDAANPLASEGVYIANGIVSNGSAALIEGYRGLYGDNQRAVTVMVYNMGTIEGNGTGSYDGIDFGANSVITNGADALIRGGVFIEGSGTIVNNTGANIVGGPGIRLNGGGTVSNAVSARIAGSYGIQINNGVGSVTNYGMIIGIDGNGVSLVSGSLTNKAVGLIEGYASGIYAGTINNGVSTAISVSNDGIIEGYFGLYSAGSNSITVGVYNGGTIKGIGTGNYDGIHLGSNGTITNGTNALIRGGIYFKYFGSITNNPRAIIAGGPGVYLHGGGTLANDVDARIEGSYGVQIDNGAGFVTNHGTIIGINGSGVSLSEGILTNNTEALIAGYTSGVYINASTASTVVTVRNYGTIEGGIFVEAGGKVTNFGTIVSGAGGTAVDFASSKDVLVDETGSTIIGSIEGGGGTLELAGAGGMLNGLGTSFSGFGTVDVLASASWTVTGINAVAGRVFDHGTLVFQAVVLGAGKALIGTAGTLGFNNAVASTEMISFTGQTGDLVLDDPSGTGLGFAGTISGFAGNDRIDLSSFAFTGKATLSWTQAGTTGTLTVKDGSQIANITLFGQYTNAEFDAVADNATGTAIIYTSPTQQAELASPHH